jgi:hypothetical protein
MSRHAAVALAAVAALGLGTACEKQSPYVTVTAGGTTVKARAVRYCRDAECDTTEDVPVLRARAGDIVGIDVPRSLADHGWAVPELNDPGFSHDHYRAFTLPENLRAGDVTLSVVRDKTQGEGQWRITLRIE